MFKGKILVLSLFLLGITFSTFAQREEHTINANWKFKRGDVSLAGLKFDDPGWKIVNLPHTWNALDVTDGRRGYYQGVSWYTKVFTVPETWKDKQLFIHFEGANQVAEVYLNGTYIGRHVGGYTAFTFDVTKFAKIGQTNELAVKVDNSNNPMIPPLSGDWTFFGGIYRDVHLVATNPVHFDMSAYGARSGVFIQTPEVSEDEASVRIFGNIVNNNKEIIEVALATTILDAEQAVLQQFSANYTLEAGETIAFDKLQETISGYNLWSPENPVLYVVRTEIVDKSTQQVLDVVEHPLGFRFYHFDGKTGFSLNGEPYKLRGANRHQDYEGMGNALPDALHRRDIELLKELGGNFIRIAHYPQDPSVLEACDKLGLLVAIEIPLVNRITQDEQFYQNTQHMMKEMIHQYYNHPSIIIWCAMNELMLGPPYPIRNIDRTLTEPERKYVNDVKQLAQRLHDIAKEADPYRYTMAVNHESYNAYDSAGLTSIFDVIGWNLYPGWYRDDITLLDSFLLNVFHAKRPDKPMIITEYGADANPRMRSHRPRRYDWTVDWANYFHAYYLQTIERYDFVAGGAIWLLTDFSSEGRKEARPHFNEKGIMTADRQPKDIYWLYKANWSEEPFLKIAPVLHDRRVGMQDADNEDYVSTQRVWVYTNLGKVELVMNGTSMGRIEPENGVAYYDVRVLNGKNRLEAKAVKEGGIISDVQLVDFFLHPNDMKASDFFNEININCGAHYDFRDDYGQVFIADKPYEKGNFGYVGGAFYMRGGGPIVGGAQIIWGTSNDPMYQTKRLNPDRYQFDVPKGLYEVTLHFAELISDKERETLVNVLDVYDGLQEKAALRAFDVSVNGQLLLADFNIAQEVGEDRAYAIRTRIRVDDEEGLAVAFKAKQDIPVVNAIQVRRVW